MKKLAFGICLLLCISCNGVAQKDGCIEIYPKESIAPISNLFWGTNLLFWVEDDAAMEDGKIEKALTELPCRLLRFPGGTAADNYHWETGLLEHPELFPHEDGQTECDFDEFMAVCNRIGAEPLIVVNTQSWAEKGDIEGGAAEAARWVRYCKEKDYKVRYWEIGNETYWHEVMTGREYGKLASTYIRAMKAVDPGIKTSVNGGWDKGMTGNKERLVNGEVVKPWTVGEKKWWDEVIAECGDDADMVSVHWYYFNEKLGDIDSKISELRSHLRELKPDKNYPICLSEYNCNTKEDEKRLCGFAESIGRFLNCGVEMSCFWPMRIGGYGNRSMLDLKTKEPQYPYQIFQLFESTLKGDMVRCSNDGDIFTFASFDGKRLTAVQSGRNLKTSRTVMIHPNTSLKRKTTAVTLYAPDGKGRHLVSTAAEFAEENGVITYSLEPGTFAVITIEK